LIPAGLLRASAIIPAVTLIVPHRLGGAIGENPETAGTAGEGSAAPLEAEARWRPRPAPGPAWRRASAPNLAACSPWSLLAPSRPHHVGDLGVTRVVGVHVAVLDVRESQALARERRVDVRDRGAELPAEARDEVVQPGVERVRERTAGDGQILPQQGRVDRRREREIRRAAERIGVGRDDDLLRRCVFRGEGPVQLSQDVAVRRRAAPVGGGLWTIMRCRRSTADRLRAADLIGGVRYGGR
jgi:hypothetical protein